MNITTKFNIGEEIYWEHEDIIRKGKIEQIRIFKKENIFYKCGHGFFNMYTFIIKEDKLYRKGEIIG